MINSLMRVLSAVAVGAVAGLASPAHAALIALTSDPATWRVENYPNDLVAIWYAVQETECPGRQMVLDPAFVKSDVNRFWPTYSIARNGGPKMFVYYEIVESPKRCLVRSFGVDNAR